MEFKKITNFLDITSDNKDLPKFVTKKWIEVYDQSEKNYDPNKETRIKTSVLRSDLCDFSDAYIVFKGTITVTQKAFTADDFERPNNTEANANATNNVNNNAFNEKKLIFKNNAPFINCISKFNGILVNSGTDNDIIIHSILNSGSFFYKANFMENGVIHNNLTKNNAKAVIPLKHLSKFWRSLNIPLINCEVELILTSFKNCVLIDKLTREANYNVDPDVYEVNNPENATFQITDTKLSVPVVTLSKDNDIKLLEQLKSGFKRTKKWNKYRSQMTIQPQNNNLNYLIDPIFTSVNILFVLIFQEIIILIANYYVPKVKINDFNVLIDGKSFLIC